MPTISAGDLNYLLFVIPGFAVVWTFRRSLGVTDRMSEIEWAVWSFWWGALFMMGTFAGLPYLGQAPPSVALNNLGGVDGVIAALVPLGLIVGYVGALCYRQLHLQAAFDFLRRFTR
jgi:hypothetical protein